jgi:hypothetical protein
VTDLDRRGRFKLACKIAHDTDTQGYCVPAPNTTKYTPQELTSMSWAAFCTEPLPEADATYRIQALDCDNLFDRLKLATHMLKQKEKQLKAKLVNAGIPLKGEDGSEEEESEK